MDDDAEEVQDFFTFKPKPRKPKGKRVSTVLLLGAARFKSRMPLS